ncbi:hypothetical protein JXR93_01785 [bacterium]|nr:hypothetical protein [bacterium]
MKKTLLILILSIFFISCGQDENENRYPEFSEKLSPKAIALQKDEQFIIDKLELIYFSKNRLNENVSELISQLSESDYKELLSYLVGVKKFSDFGFTKSTANNSDDDSNNNIDLDDDSNDSENSKKVVGSKLTVSQKTWKLLFNYHDDLKVQKLISYIFSSSKNNISQQAFFLLYSLDYKFSEEELERFSNISSTLKKWIEFYYNKKSLEEITGELSLENSELSKLIEYFILVGDDSKTKSITALRADIFKSIKNWKKEISKLSKKKKSEEAQEQIEELNKKIELVNSFLPSITNYLYFFSKEKKLSNEINYVELFYQYKTPIKTGKQFYKIFGDIKKSPYPIQLLYIKYIFDKAEYKISKKDSDFLIKLLKNGKYPFLQYSYLKKYFPEQFSKLSLKNYQKKVFFKPILGLDDIQKLKEDPYQLDILERFLLNPTQINPLITTLFNAYTTKIGKESYLYMLLKILLKGNIKLPENSFESISKIKILYFQEIAKYFQE